MSRPRAFLIPLATANLILLFFCAQFPGLFLACQVGPIAATIHWGDVGRPIIAGLLLLASGFWNYLAHNEWSLAALLVALLVWYASGFYYVSLLA